MANSENYRQSADRCGSDQVYTNAELFTAIREKCKGEANEVEDRKLEQVKTCLSNGADINAVDANNTVLHIAIKNNYTKIIHYLLMMGAHTDIENSTGKSALALAQELNCNQNILNMLQLCHKGAKTKITCISDMLDSWNILKNNSKIIILEIDSIELSPEFLHQVEFYDAIDTAGNLFLVDITVSDMEHIDKDFIRSQLSRLNKQLIIQCGSHSSACAVYCRGSGDDFNIDLYSDVDKYDRNVLTQNLFCDSDFGIGSIVKALKLELIGKFTTEQRSLLNVSFDLTKLFDGRRFIDYAVTHGDVLTLRLLSLNSWDLSQYNHFWKTTTLTLAAEHGDVDKLGAVLRVKFPIELDKSILIPEETAAHFDNCKRQMLKTAVTAGNCDVTRFMISCGVQLDGDAIELAWENKRYDVVLIMLRADCVFPYDFDLNNIDDKRDGSKELNTFVTQRDEMHGYIEKGDLHSVKEYVKLPSKLYLNKKSESAIFTALKHSQLKIFVWLKCDLEAEFRHEDERKKLGEGVLDIANEALHKTFVPIENAHIVRLVASSRSRKFDAGFKNYIESIYMELNTIKEISMLFQVLQFCDHVDIIYDLNKGSVDDMKLEYSESTKGWSDYKSGTVYIGAKVDKQELKGTIAHELTHLAIATVFDNDGKPYKAKDTAMRDHFDKIVQTIKSKSFLLDGIIERVFSCYKDPANWPSELIVRVNHILATYGSTEGLVILEEEAKPLLEFYKVHVEPRFQSLVADSHLIKPRNAIKFLNAYSGVIGRLDKMKIRFNESNTVEQFLSNKDKQILVVGSTSTWLSLINVYQNISLSEDSFLIFQFDHYFSRKIVINQALFNEAGKLLVLECPNAVSPSDLYIVLWNLGKIVWEKKDKKIILIVETGELDFFQSRLSRMNYYTVRDELTLNSLTSESIQALLTKQVSLQNREIPLGDLVDNDSYSLVDAEVITKLINNEKVTIGKQPIDSKGYDEKYYVEREFNNKIKVDKDILVHSDCKHVFAISGTTVEIVKMLVNNKYKVCSFNEFNIGANTGANTGVRYVVLDSDHAHSQFKCLRGNFGKKIIHWLEVKDGDLICHKSHSSLDIAHHFPKDICRNSEQNVVSIDMFDGQSDIIAVSDTDDATIKKLVSDKFAVERCNYIILDSDQDNRQFEKLRDKFPSKNIYWLKRKISGLFWHQTSAVSDLHNGFNDVLSILRRYTDHSFPNIKHENEFITQIANFKEVLVPDLAGMGKTTVLTRIIKLLNETYPHLWVISAGLNDFIDALNNQNYSTRTTEEALNVFVRKLLNEQKQSKLETEFEKRLLLHLVKNREDKVIIMLDGFNKITNEHRSVIIDILYALRHTKLKQLWVTTTPRINGINDHYLEDVLQLIPYNLQPFSKEIQIKFLIDYWKKMFGLVDEDRLQLYANALMNHVSGTINNPEFPLSGTPLITKALAEKFRCDCEQFCNYKIDCLSFEVKNLVYDLLPVVISLGLCN